MWPLHVYMHLIYAYEVNEKKMGPNVYYVHILPAPFYKG